MNEYNLWRGFAVEPNPRGAAGCPKFLAHIRDNAARGVEEIYVYIISFFADMVQHPDAKPGVSMFFRGLAGVGKTIIGLVIGMLFPNNYLLLEKSEQLLGQFNAHMASALLIQAEEAFWAGDKKGHGVLKHLITSNKISIEPKGKDSFMVDSFARLIGTSNDDWVVPTSFDDRR